MEHRRRQARVAIHVGDVDDGTVEDRPAGHAVAIRRPRIDAEEFLRSRRVGLQHGSVMDQGAVELEHVGAVSLAQAGRATTDGVEHRSHVRLRPIDDGEHVGGGAFALQSLGEIAIACRELVEHAGVLDGDAGLLGEGLDELDLAVREGLDLTAPASDDTDGHAVLEDRNAEVRPVGRRPLEHFQGMWVIVRVVQDIHDVDGPSVDNGPAHDEPAVRWTREQAVIGLPFTGRHVVDGHQVKEPALASGYCAEACLAQAGRPLHDGVEDRPDVGRRARDEAEDLGGGRLLFQRLRQPPTQSGARGGVGPWGSLPADGGGGLQPALRGLRTLSHQLLLNLPRRPLNSG